MTRRTIERFVLRAGATLALLALPAGAALAEEPTPTKRLTSSDVQREILMASSDRELRSPSADRSTLSLDEKSGVAWVHKLKMGNRSFDFRIKGPVLRKQKALGLRFKIRF